MFFVSHVNAMQGLRSYCVYWHSYGEKSDRVFEDLFNLYGREFAKSDRVFEDLFNFYGREFAKSDRVFEDLFNLYGRQFAKPDRADRGLV